MRRKQIYKNKKLRKPDPKYNNFKIGRFINYLMKGGGKSVAQKIFYQTMEKIEKETKKNPLEVFEKAIENTSPIYEVISRRIGGANYRVPREVRFERKFFLSSKWLIDACLARKSKPMFEKLAEEIISASKNEGAAVKKKQEIHRMAEANRAFAHFAR